MVASPSGRVSRAGRVSGVGRSSLSRRRSAPRHSAHARSQYAFPSRTYATLPRGRRHDGSAHRTIMARRSSATLTPPARPPHPPRRAGRRPRACRRVSIEQARRSTVATRVLVVEDEENTRILFGDILRHLAYEPILARSAEAARAAIASAAPDIILLDVRLPLMSGYEFLRLRAIRESKIPIVAVSGAATESDARSCLHFGALDFLRKHVALDLLRAVLQYAAVRAREGHRDLEREAGNR